MEHLVFISHSSKDALIAQLICHRLEEDGIPCWIAPRDIKHQDWESSIMAGLAASDVCVIIISGDSTNSPEVLKEVAQATCICQYIIPFRIDAASLPERMDYHLRPCHWMDASTPPIEQRVEELKNKIKSLSDGDVVYFNNTRQKLISRIVWPKQLFLGRERELEEIGEALSKENIIFLQGMGGIGKSEIAKSYAKQNQDRYDTVVFLSYDGSLRSLIIGNDLSIENFAPWNTESESEDQFYQRKLAALRSISTDKTLIILDNYDVDGDEDFADLANMPFHLIVTTRYDHDEYSSLKIGPIEDFDKVREIFIKSYGKQPRPEDIQLIDEMIRLVNCHTITVELLGKQMKASRKKATDMLAMLKTEGVNLHLKEKVKQENSTEAASAFDFISKLFRFSALSNEEEKVLRFMTMVPYSGIDIEMFYDICELESYDEINDLIAHSWLMLDEDTDVLSMHPIIADVVKSELSPDKDTVVTYIKGLRNTDIFGLWFASQEEKVKKWPLIYHILRHYSDPIPEAWSEYGSMSSLAWICGYYPLSIQSSLRVLDMVKREFPEDMEKQGFCGRTVGGCYHNSGDDISAESYYEMGLEATRAAIKEDSPQELWTELFIAYQKVGRCAYLKGDFEKSKAHLEESERIAEIHQEFPGVAGCGDTCTELTRMYITMGDWEQALVYCKKSLELFNGSFGAESPNHAYSYTDFGRIYTAMKRFDEAEVNLNKALELNIRYHGENNRQTFWAREAIADLEAARGDIEKADKLFFELQMEMEKDFGENNPTVIELKKKREAIKLEQKG